MFQYRVEEQVFNGDNLKIFNGLIKTTKEEIEITAIKRACYKQNAQKMEIESYLKSVRDILTLIDVFPSTVFPANSDGEWLIVVETKKYLNLTDVILTESKKIDILSLIFEILSTMLIFSNYYNCEDDDECIIYQRLIPQNIFISEHNEIFLKFPYWLLINIDMHKNELNFADSFRYYSPLLFANQNGVNADIWAFGCCLAEIFYGVPLFASINENDQILKMFQILKCPKHWIKWPMSDGLRASITLQQQQQGQKNEDMLNRIIHNETMSDLIRCCFECPQISLNQLCVFLEMSKNEKEPQRELTFEDIRSWNKQKEKEKVNDDDQNNVVLVGSASFINEWSLFDQNKQSKETKLDNKSDEKKQKIQKQKSCQTIQIQTTDASINTETQATKVTNLTISDCIKDLPVIHGHVHENEVKDEEENEDKAKQNGNLLIIEFSDLCLISMPKNGIFSFQCQMDDNDVLSASPNFNIDDLLSNKTEKIYIHLMVSSKECEFILKTLTIQMIAHNKTKTEIGEICIDVRALKEGNQMIEGHYDILSTQNNGNQRKLGTVFIRILPQFHIADQLSVSLLTSPAQSCNQSVITDDQSVASTEAWKMFNTFIVHKS